MSCKVVFTDTAKGDLLEIARGIAELSKDKNLAIRFVRELQQETKCLEQFPESGAVPRDRGLKAAGTDSWSMGSICCSICTKRRRMPRMSWQCSMESGIICG